MKRFLIIFFLIITNCSKEDSCDCRYSDVLGGLVPEEFTEEFLLERIDTISEEQKRSLNAECARKCD